MNDGSVQMTAPSDAAPERVKTVLPARYIRFSGATVFNEE